MRWDLRSPLPADTEFLTFLNYLNSVEPYGHFTMDPGSGEIDFSMAILEEGLEPELPRTARLLGIPLRAWASNEKNLRALLEHGQPAVEVYHHWMQDLLVQPAPPTVPPATPPAPAPSPAPEPNRAPGPRDQAERHESRSARLASRSSEDPRLPHGAGHAEAFNVEDSDSEIPRAEQPWSLTNILDAPHYHHSYSEGLYRQLRSELTRMGLEPRSDERRGILDMTILDPSLHYEGELVVKTSWGSFLCQAKPGLFLPELKWAEGMKFLNEVNAALTLGSLRLRHPQHYLCYEIPCDCGSKRPDAQLIRSIVRRASAFWLNLAPSWSRLLRPSGRAEDALQWIDLRLL